MTKTLYKNKTLGSWLFYFLCDAQKYFCSYRLEVGINQFRAQIVDIRSQAHKFLFGIDHCCALADPLTFVFTDDENLKSLGFYFQVLGLLKLLQRESRKFLAPSCQADARYCDQAITDLDGFKPRVTRPYFLLESFP